MGVLAYSDNCLQLPFFFEKVARVDVSFRTTLTSFWRFRYNFVNQSKLINFILEMLQKV